MNHQEYVLNLIKKKYIVTKPTVRAVLTHYLTTTQHTGIYVEFKPKKNMFTSHYQLFINDKVGAKCFHNSPGLLGVSTVPHCLWFKEEYDTIEELPKGLKI